MVWWNLKVRPLTWFFLNWAVRSCGAVCYAAQGGSNFWVTIQMKTTNKSLMISRLLSLASKQYFHVVLFVSGCFQCKINLGIFFLVRSVAGRFAGGGGGGGGGECLTFNLAPYKFWHYTFEFIFCRPEDQLMWSVSVVMYLKKTSVRNIRIPWSVPWRYNLMQTQ